MLGTRLLEASSPTNTTPAASRSAQMTGRRVSARSACMTSDSAALQTLVRCVLAFITMLRAISASADASTYMWQFPSPSIMTGTVAFSRTLLISAGPPRGIRQSTYSVRRMTPTAVSCDASSTSTRQSSGSPAAANPLRIASAIARFERSALPEPRSSAAFPDFRQSPAASEVTLGRFS